MWVLHSWGGLTSSSPTEFYQIWKEYPVHVSVFDSCHRIEQYRCFFTQDCQRFRLLRYVGELDQPGWQQVPEFRPRLSCWNPWLHPRLDRHEPPRQTMVSVRLLAALHRHLCGWRLRPCRCRLQVEQVCCGRAGGNTVGHARPQLIRLWKASKGIKYVADSRSHVHVITSTANKGEDATVLTSTPCHEKLLASGGTRSMHSEHLHCTYMTITDQPYRRYLSIGDWLGRTNLTPISSVVQTVA